MFKGVKLKTNETEYAAMVLCRYEQTKSFKKNKNNVQRRCLPICADYDISKADQRQSNKTNMLLFAWDVMTVFEGNTEFVCVTVMNRAHSYWFPVRAQEVIALGLR